MSTPPIVARAQAKRRDLLQEGMLLSWTTVHHPPKGFAQSPRTIGLVALDDGRHVMGQLIPVAGQAPSIGDRVKPRMKLTRTTEQGLRIYDIAFEILARRPVPVVGEEEFAGYILALTGPSGVGKSTIGRKLALLMESVESVPILTTRTAKKGDDGEYRYVSLPEFQKLRQEGALAAEVRIPSVAEERWYGYLKEDIAAIRSHGKIPLVITEQKLLLDLAKTYGRRAILSCGLLPPGATKRAMLSQLLHRMRSRGRDTEEQIAARIKNAKSDLQFFEKRKELFDHLVVNDQLENVVDTIKGYVLQSTNA